MLQMSDLDLAKHYNKWWKEIETNGKHDIYIITFLFDHLKFMNDTPIISLMNSSLEEFISNLLPRIIRKPHRLAYISDKPIMILFYDLPVYKTTSKFITKKIVNNGLHPQGIIAIPKKSRLKCKLDQHIKSKRLLYVPKDGLVKDIHLERVIDSADYVSDYVFKHLKRCSFSSDLITILPRSITEVSNASKFIT